MSDLPLWSATIMRPSNVSAEALSQARHVRQCYIYGRAKSRAEFARKLIACGVERRSVAAVSAWLRDWGNSNDGHKSALEAVTDDRIYLAALDHRPGDPVLPYPPDKATS